MRDEAMKAIFFYLITDLNSTYSFIIADDPWAVSTPRRYIFWASSEALRRLLLVTLMTFLGGPLFKLDSGVSCSTIILKHPKHDDSNGLVSFIPATVDWRWALTKLS